MAFTSSEESRMSLIETTINKMLVWLRNTVSDKQFRQLLLIRQNEFDDITTRLTALETSVTLLTNRLNQIQSKS